MDGVSFQVWLEAIGLLTAVQRQAGFACLALAAADDDRDPIPYDTAWTAPLLAEPPSGAADGQPAETGGLAETGAPVLPASASAAAASRIEHSGCPHCASRDLQRWGRVSDLPRYRCRACRRTFNGLTGTPMARLRKKDRWAALSRRTTGCVAMAARPSSGSPASGAFRAKSCPLPAAQGPRHLTFTSTISTDTTAVSRNGCAPSMASPPSISIPIWEIGRASCRERVYSSV